MSKPKWTRIEIRLGDIIGWEGNPRLSTVAQAERIIKSEERWGQTLPFFVSPFIDGAKVRCYDGHQRLSAWLTKHGEDFIVKAEQSDRILTEDEQREFVITHHVGATGSLDWGKLASWNAPKLIEWGMDMTQKKDWDNDANNLKELLAPQDESIVNVENEAIPEQFAIMITCKTEQEQVSMLERFLEEGLQCRALIS